MKTKIWLLSGLFILLFAMSAYGEWEIGSKKDEMTGKQTVYAFSLRTISTKVMSFPYRNTMAWIGIGCNSVNEWVYIGFDTSPNLNKKDTKNGYNLIRTRVKWDNKIENIILIQHWGAKGINFQDAQLIISKIAKHKTMLLELDWYGQGRVYFKFQLEGSSDALKKIRSYF